ncbi:MAG: hypothetical protein HYX78_13260 [Armatimonadetes bacterium]|nr:hypothetical protein [Armatimonadota bacterium]
MASLINELNDLLERTRSSVEAARLVAEEIVVTDPDIERGIEDIVDGDRWSSSGLYHRITQLGGTPTLLSDGFSSRVATKENLLDKLKAFCNNQKAIARLAGSIMSRHELDEPTRELLDEIKRLHAQNARRCEQMMHEWDVG